MRYLYTKRIIDFILAMLLLIPFGFIICLCVIAIKLESPGPAFYIQERPGYKGRIFKIHKLRTMIVETRIGERELSDMERLTKSGRFIRALSLDELPQIWNILIGEMSFIGPRPLLVQYLSLYSEEQMKRHDVLPGISGWAQVNGRNAISWEEKFNQDLWYVENLCLKLDFKIFWLTIIQVISRKGINQNSETTMRGFFGNID